MKIDNGANGIIFGSNIIDNTLNKSVSIVQRKLNNDVFNTLRAKSRRFLSGLEDTVDPGNPPTQNQMDNNKLGIVYSNESHDYHN